jgi:hypothetical protein
MRSQSEAISSHVTRSPGFGASRAIRWHSAALARYSSDLLIRHQKTGKGAVPRRVKLPANVERDHPDSQKDPRASKGASTHQGGAVRIRQSVVELRTPIEPSKMWRLTFAACLFRWQQSEGLVIGLDARQTLGTSALSRLQANDATGRP